MASTDRTAPDAPADPVVAGGSSPVTRFDELDGLRALAMTLVFVYHFGLFTGPFLEIGPGLAAPTTWGARVIPNLQVGVEIFFVLSGILIYGPFARARARGAPGPGLRRYARRRFLRIYPAYWLALVVLLLRDDIYVNGFANFLKHASLTQTYWPDFGKVGTREPGMVVAWTLVVEVSFYVFAPLWAHLVARRVTVRVECALLGLLTALGLFVRVWSTHHRVGPWVLVLPPALAALAPGMLTAIALAHRGDRPTDPRPWWAARWPWHLGALVVAFAMARLAYGYPVYPILGVNALAWHKVLGPPLAALVVIPVALVPARRRWRPLAHPAVVWVGTVSYGAYLWHHGLMYHHIDREAVLDLSAFNDALLMTGLYGFVLLVAAGSWYLVERPALRWADRRPRPSARSRVAPVTGAGGAGDGTGAHS